MRFSPVVALVAASCAAGGALSAQGGESEARRSAVEHELIALIDRNIRTATSYDPAVADFILADDYVSINSAGVRGDKAGAIRLYRTRQIKLDTSLASELRVRSYGNTAVVTGVWRFAGLNNGIPRAVARGGTAVRVTGADDRHLPARRGLRLRRRCAVRRCNGRGDYSSD